jgi:hypothetical protein
MRSHLVAALLIVLIGAAVPNAGAQDEPLRTKVPLVSVHLQGASVREAIQELFRAGGERYILGPDLPEASITLSMERVEFPTALETLARLTGLTFRHENHLYVIGLTAETKAASKPTGRVPVLGEIPIIGQLFQSPGKPATPGSLPVPGERKVTLGLKETPLRQALEQLFRGTGLRCAVELGVPNPPITLSLRGQPFEVVLQRLVDHAGVKYRREGQFFIIERPPFEAARPHVPGVSWGVELELPAQSHPSVRLDERTRQRSKIPMVFEGEPEFDLPGGVRLRASQARVTLTRERGPDSPWRLRVERLAALPEP